MTPQIKQRIEQIRRGEVPEGYKKTKVGIVPEEWEEHKLSHYLTVNNDKNTDLKYTSLIKTFSKTTDTKLLILYLTSVNLG